MPLYEYRCQHCQHKVMLYHKTFTQSPSFCPHCNHNALQRLFSTFSVGKTDKELYDNILNDSQLTRGMMNNDPRALAEWNKRMSRGEAVAPEYEEMMDRMERGEFATEMASVGTSEITTEKEAGVS